jgi:hypothetical protein
MCNRSTVTNLNNCYKVKRRSHHGQTCAFERGYKLVTLGRIIMLPHVPQPYFLSQDISIEGFTCFHNIILSLLHPSQQRFSPTSLHNNWFIRESCMRQPKGCMQKEHKLPFIHRRSSSFCTQVQDQRSSFKPECLGAISSLIALFDLVNSRLQTAPKTLFRKPRVLLQQ